MLARNRWFTLATLVFTFTLGCSQQKPAKKTQETAQPETAAVEGSKSDTVEVASPIVGEELSYLSGDTELKGYLAHDKSLTGARPGVLVVHEWWGHNEFARSRARALAEMGYTALAVDMYGGGRQASHPEDAKKFMGEVVANLDEGVRRFEAAKAVLEGHPSTDPAQTAAIGYCFGGAVVLHMARLGMDLDAVASFHGSLAPNAVPADSKLRAKLLVAHGAADPFVSAEEVEAFRSEMKAAGADLTFVAYEGAKHAFTNPGATALGKKFKLPLEYNEAADRGSWSELEKLLRTTFPR